MTEEAEHRRYPEAISQRNAEGGRLREQERQRSEEEAQPKTYEQSRKITTTRDRVFICYAREDEAFVLQLGKNLKGRGVPVWLDQWDIPPGSDWDQSIENAIYDCAKFIIVLSSRAVESSEVRVELRTALDEKKRIIPVIHSTCRVLRELRTIQHIDFTSRGPDDEAALRQLLRTLEASAVIEVPQQAETTDSAAREAEQARAEAEAKWKADEENRRRTEEETNRAQQEAKERRLEVEAQRKAEDGRLREQERQRSEKEAKRKAEAERLREREQKRYEEEARRKANEEKEENRAQRTDVVLELGDVFLSYSREDDTYVKKLLGYLRKEGLSVWADDQIDYGDRWWKTIVARIRNCVAVVVVMTPSSEKSEWVEREILFALNQKKSIFPLLLKGEPFPLLLSAQHHDVTNGEVPPPRFVATLRRLAASKDAV